MKTPTIKGTLKKSTTNPTPPLIAENQPVPHKGKPVTRPNSPTGSTKGHEPLLNMNQPPSSSRTSSTFRAPRGSESSNPADCGYTKPGKM